jgi:hypothetical protein
MIAVALTLVALPALISANRRSTEERPATVAVVAPPGGATASGQLASGAPSADPSTTPTTVIPIADQTTLAAGVPATSVTVTTTAPPSYQHLLEGKATFQRYDQALWGPAACSATGIPIGTEVHVLNTNSGQTAACTVRAHLDPGASFVLVTDAAVFSAIGDPVVGVVPVRITW